MKERSCHTSTGDNEEPLEEYQPQDPALKGLDVALGCNTYTLKKGVTIRLLDEYAIAARAGNLSGIKELEKQFEVENLISPFASATICSQYTSPVLEAGIDGGNIQVINHIFSNIPSELRLNLLRTPYEERKDYNPFQGATTMNSTVLAYLLSFVPEQERATIQDKVACKEDVIPFTLIDNINNSPLSCT